MNSLQALNNFGGQTIEVDDTRPATVIFDVDPKYVELDTEQTYTSTTTTFTSTINVEEIRNYATANLRFRVSVITLGITPASTIDFGTLPTGITQSQAGEVYTLSGFKTSTEWLSIIDFIWTRPNDYANANLLYLKLELLYYDASLNSEQIIDWVFYDDLYYYDAVLVSSFSQSVSYTRIKSASASMISRFVPEIYLPSTLTMRVLLTASGDTTSIVNLTLSASASAEANVIKSYGIESMILNTTITYDSGLTAALVQTISDDTTYIQLQQAVFTSDLTKMVAFGYNKTTQYWGLLYYTFSASTNTATFNTFVPILSAPLQIKNSILQPNPTLRCEPGLAVGRNIETSTDTEVTSLYATLYYHSGSVATSIYHVRRSNGVVSSTINALMPRVASDALVRAHRNDFTTNKNISVRNATNGSEIALVTPTGTAGPISLQYEPVGGRYWLAYREIQNVSGTDYYRVQIHNSSNTYATKTTLINASSAQSTPQLVQFDPTGTRLVVVRNATGYTNRSYLEVYNLVGNSWALDRTFDLYGTGLLGIADVRFARNVEVSNLARNIMFRIEDTALNILNLLLEWNGSTYITKTYSLTYFDSANSGNVPAFNSSISAKDRYFTTSDWNSLEDANPVSELRIYRYQG